MRLVVRRLSRAGEPPTGDGGSNFPQVRAGRRDRRAVDRCAFDPRWGGPARSTFDKLAGLDRPAPSRASSSTPARRPTARRSTAAAMPPAGTRLWLDLGNVRELAEVRLNGKTAGHRLGAAVPRRHHRRDSSRRAIVLEVEVVNFWPNRIIGDQSLPPEKRLTRTNIRKLTKDTPLMPSGLLGPVTLQSIEP